MKFSIPRSLMHDSTLVHSRYADSKAKIKFIIV
jgi:hypothetical protein